MLELINDWLVRGADIFLYWSLYLPRDLTLLIVSIGSSAVLALVRLAVTDQPYLHQIKRDKARLKVKMKEAKKEKNKEEVKRIRALNGMVALRALAAEKKPLLYALLPIILLATWALNRLDYFPPEVGEEVVHSIYLPMTAAGETIIFLPDPESPVELASGPIQIIQRVTDHPTFPPHGLGQWTVRGTAEGGPHLLRIRHGEDIYEHPFKIGGVSYATPSRLYPQFATGNNPPPATMTELRQYRPFGFVPAVHPIFFPPWLLAYLIIVIPFVLVIRRLLRIA